ncbi:MAG: N,N-dimethylformamidase beta subunit family domain-containing protein [Myxococcota bacterium]
MSPTLGSLAIALGLMFGAVSAHAQCASAPNPIVCENALAGSEGWRIDGQLSTDTGGEIQGYASATSVDTGDSIDFHVTVAGDASWTLEIYRMGWYGGMGGRLLVLPAGSPAQPLAGVQQPTCLTPDPPDLPEGYLASVDCDWSSSYTLAVPAEWTTGIYLAKLENASTGHQSYIMFVVREDDRTATYYYEQAVMNYHAYNRYPTSGGVSFYTGAGSSSTRVWNKRLSFDRPYSSSFVPRNNQGPFGSVGNGSGGFFTWDFPMIGWLEKEGYDVSYATNVDLHVTPDRVLDFSAMISVGHDEYWSDEMAAAASRARDAGVDLAFFSGNHVFGTVIYDPVARAMTGTTKAGGPGVSPAWWDHADDYPDKRKRQALIGQANTGCCARKPATYYNVDWIVDAPGHWVFDGAGFSLGDRVPGIVGYEPDSYDASFVGVCSQDFTLLSASPFDPVAAGATTNSDTSFLNPWVLDFAHSTIYEAPSGAWVFSAGTTDWPWGLNAPFAAGVGSFQAISGVPTLQGFTQDVSGSASSGIVIDVDGLPTWEANGTGGRAQANRSPDGSEAWGLAQGYTLTAEIRVQSGGWITAYYASGATRFLPRISVDGGGNLDVELEGGPLLEDVATGAAATAYHTHEIVYDGASESATYSLDGVVLATGWAGSSSGQRGAYFGQAASTTSGSARVRSFSLTPASILAPDPRIEIMTRNILNEMADPIDVTAPLFYEPDFCEESTPERMGWTGNSSGAGAGALTTDTVAGVAGVSVWHADGSSGRAVWEIDPSDALVAHVAQNGWRIESIVRVLGGNFVTDYYADGSQRFLPILGRAPNGDLNVQLEGGGSYVLASGEAADDYHEHVVVFNPLTGLATYYFDGAAIETWAGSPTAQRQVTFGQGSTPIAGEAYYRSMRFEPAPEPGFAMALGVGVVLLGFAGRRSGMR